MPGMMETSASGCFSLNVLNGMVAPGLRRMVLTLGKFRA